MVVDQVAILVFAGLLGGLLLSYARRRRKRAQALSRLVTDGGSSTADGTRTVNGLVEVDSPAEPQQRPPDHHDSDESADPALWAWRIRRERASSGDHWETVESGLAVGEFAVRDDWDRVRIDDESLGEVDDPFSAEHLFLGEPETEVYVEERDGLLEAVSGDYGPVEDVEVSISIGSETTTPNKYQATVVRAGDELLARGRAEDGGELPVLRGDVEIGIGNLQARAEGLFSSARRWGVAGAAVIVLGVAGVVATLVF